MARYVTRTATAPVAVGEGENKKWICMCGLTGDLPFCDGSHKKARSEDEEKLYVYTADKEDRKEVSEL